MKILSLFLILAASLATTACDSNQQPKIENPFAGHVEALNKAKDVERLLQEATDKRLRQIDGLK